MLSKLNNELSDLIIKIGKKCKKERKFKNLTQLDLAFYSETETSTISKIERFAVDNISLKTLLKISIVLEISINDFLI